MKQLILTCILSCLTITLFGQLPLKQLEEVQSKNPILIPAYTSYLGLNSTFDSIIVQVPSELEIRNDSLCIVGDGCLTYISGLGGVEDYTLFYDTIAQGFDITKIKDGITTDTSFRFYPLPSEVQLNEPIVIFTETNSEPWEVISQQIHQFRFDNNIDSEELNDSITKLRIGYQEGDLFGYQTIYHDSLEININDLDSDPTNELQDTTNFPNLLEFVQNNSSDTQLTDEEVQDIAGGMTTGNTETLIDVTYQDGDGTIDFVVENDLSLYDNSTSGFFNTQAAANYWTLSSGNLSYSDGNVLVGTASINRDVVINGRINIQNNASNVFIGEEAGNTTATGVFNFGIGRNALESLTTGLLNIGIGSSSLKSMQTGSFNSAIGSESLESNSIGSYNASFGHKSQELNTGSKNVSLGSYSMSSSTGADDNVVVGYQAGRDITGDKNVMVGFEVGKTFTGSNTLYIDNQDTGAPLIHGDFSTNILEINGDLDVTGDFESNGKVTVGDNIEGNAVNIAGYDSQNDLTRVSIGDNLTLTSGTLAADDQTPVQSFGSASMNSIDYDIGDYPSYMNVSINSENGDNGDVSVNTSLFRLEIDSDGGGWYMCTVQGVAWVEGGGSNQKIQFFTDTGSYDLISTLYLKDGDDQSFSLSFPIEFSNNDDIILAIKAPTTPTANINIGTLDFTIVRI